MPPKPQPESHQAPVVQRIRVRYAKRGPLRFTSHRDFARAFERAVQRAGVPVAFSHGFTPHPRISYAGAAPTGTASEAEYLELGLQARVDPDDLVKAQGGNLAERIDASHWRIELPGIDDDTLEAAVVAFHDATEVPVRRLTKQGWREFDARSAVARITRVPTASPVEGAGCAILDLV